jgi:hypothetical protein
MQTSFLDRNAEVATSIKIALRMERSIQPPSLHLYNGRREKPHPSNYRDYSHSKEEPLRRNLQRDPTSEIQLGESSPQVSHPSNFLRGRSPRRSAAAVLACPVEDDFRNDSASCRIHIHNIEEDKKAAIIFISSNGSAYKLSTHKLTLSEINNKLPCLYHLLQLK